jgi:hypothetical protein
LAALIFGCTGGSDARGTPSTLAPPATSKALAAVACAESFVRRAGYAEQAANPKDIVPYDWESDDVDTVIRMRHATMLAKAVTVCPGRAVGMDGHYVVFRYSSPREVDAGAGIHVDDKCERPKPVMRDLRIRTEYDPKTGCAPVK